MRFAICQELYEDIDWSEQCRLIAEAGYTGIELAPFTLSTAPETVTDAELDRMRETADSFGLTIIGLHWLLAKTEGLHLTSPDADIRRRTAEYLGSLSRICHRLGGTVMVHGSPQQRDLMPGVSMEDAMGFAADVYRQVLPTFAEHSTVLCFEPLTEKETNFINTCEQAMMLIREVNHPNLQLHQDVKAMLGAECDPLPEVIHRYRDVVRHFHVNDTNLLGPGMGETDFEPILRALLDTEYEGWISVEVFDYTPGAQRIAVESLRYMNSVLDKIRSV